MQFRTFMIDITVQTHKSVSLLYVIKELKKKKSFSFQKDETPHGHPVILEGEFLLAANVSVNLYDVLQKY